MAWTVELTHIATDTTIADITTLCRTTKLLPRMNRPLPIVVDMPANQSLLKTIQADGDPALYAGTRGLKVKQDGVMRGHGIITTMSYSGGTEQDTSVEVTAFDPMARLARRMIWDGTGTIAYPVFANPITGGTLLRQVIANSIANEDDLGTPRRLEISTSGATDTTTVNVYHLLPDAPLTIGELITTLTDTGVVDVVMTPVDSSMGYPAGVMARMDTFNAHGSDRSGTVHFDYDTGLKNVAAARRLIDAGTLGNEIVYELGPKIDNNHYRGNISGTETGAAPGSEDLTAYQALQLASRAKYGSQTEYRVYDDDGDGDSRPLFHRLWKTEVQLRTKPRDLLYLTPAARGDNFTQFRPFIDFNLGDLVAVNVSANLGPAIANTKQRIYGFDVEIDVNGVERIGELVTSADAE